MNTQYTLTQAILNVFPISRKLLLISSLTVLSQASLAAKITVNSLADNEHSDGQCTLREAISNANQDDSGVGDCKAGNGKDIINFAVNGNIPLDSQLILDSDITLKGPGAEKLSLDGQGQNRVMMIKNGAIVEVEGITIENGWVESQNEFGGGISNEGELVIINSFLLRNYGKEAGGGLSNKGTTEITNSTLSENYAGYGGGFINFGTVIINNSNISKNHVRAVGGGGFYNDFGTVIITNSTFSENSGGGISNLGTVIINNSIFSYNYFKDLGRGGGIYNSRDSEVTVANSFFFQNDAFIGGGIDNGGIITIINSTFSKNSANTYGGGLNNRGTTTIINSTLSENIANMGNNLSNQGTFRNRLHLKNTLIANSPQGNDCFSDKALDTHINNLIEDGTCSEGAINLITGDPKLLPLANNGGPTPTHALAKDSPALDQGDDTECPETDQRGQSRPQDGNNDGQAHCDIGAFERESESTLIKLTSVDAQYQASKVIITWQTGWEIDTAGFWVWRARAPQKRCDDFQALEDIKVISPLIPSTFETGGTYTFADSNITPGIYCYAIEDYDLEENKRSLHLDHIISVEVK